MTHSPDFQKILHKVILPALAGGVGTGAVSGYLSSKRTDPNETRGERRRRILRNAAYGTALGGAAGAMLPSGASMLNDTFLGSDSPKNIGVTGRAFDRVATGGMKHLLPTATALGGGYGIMHSGDNNQKEVLRELTQQLKNEPINPDDADKLLNPEFAGKLNGNIFYGNSSRVREQIQRPGGVERILSLMATRKGTPAASRAHSMFRNNELIQASGLHPGLSLKEMADMHDVSPAFADSGFKFQNAPGLMEGEYKKYLASKGPVSRLMSHFSTPRIPGIEKLTRNSALENLMERHPNQLPNVWRARQALENVNPSSIAEQYGRYMRPGMPQLLERVTPLGKLGLLGGGVWAANALQNKLMGN